MGKLLALLSGLFLLAACAGEEPPNALADARGYEFPPPPSLSPADSSPRVEQAAEVLAASATGELDLEALSVLSDSGDPRWAWLLSDFLRFFQLGRPALALVEAFETLTGVDPTADPSFTDSPWRSITDHLLAWDLPPPPRYRELKASLFLLVEPKWEPFFTDADAATDWRLLSWGGVFIDDRPPGDTGFCERGCIPALDDPGLVEAEAGDWYPNANIVFGVVVGNEAVAFPKHIMEVHEMVNVTIGGRRLGIPYCTLCGSAQAFFTDELPQPVVLRTSGLLSRSNKVMFDLTTFSAFDTFQGTAWSGPLQGMELAQTTVVSSSWGDWKDAHPLTRIVAQDGGIGRIYPEDPLGGRDAAGPIFPVGPVDPRLPVQAQVVGVTTEEGPVAFPVDSIRPVIEVEGEIRWAGVVIVADGGGFRAVDEDGNQVPSHQAFWFAWSQFNPGTAVWTPLPSS
ncbi:MAG TPA: DUF3179 domain-containing (seleno)protein [Acidimicrobiia bacterium]|nr:DUF3179 domain-containing (seleno)protein [Acidimicrobiia bacterium]